MQYFDMAILDPLFNKKQGKQFAVVITDRYTKLTIAIPTTKTSVTIVAHIFLVHWVPNYRIQFKLTINHGF